jgi:hypothetical protein
MAVKSIEKMGKTLAVWTVLALAAIGAGLAVAWYMGNHDKVATVVLPEEVSIPQPVLPDPPATVPRPRPGISAQPAMERGWTNPVPDPDAQHWEQKLDEILLGSSGIAEVNDKSDAILKLMTVAPPNGQRELAQHLINMTQDDHYDGVAQLLTNAATQTDVSTVLMNDLLNRRNTLKLPMLLAIARNPDHPLDGQAKDMLSLFLQADYDTNWDQWSAAVDTWLQQNQ